MKIIITADIHNGVPKRLDDCIWSMRTIRNYAYENDIGVILILGDLFHDRYSLDIDILTQVYPQPRGALRDDLPHVQRIRKVLPPSC